MEPTQEQIKEFWEWCGLKQVCSPERDSYKRGIWEDLDCMRIDTPLIDLKNLFKWAVPKLPPFEAGNGIDAVVSFDILDDGTITCDIEAQGTIVSANANDFAPALFWALWQVKGATMNKEKIKKGAVDMCEKHGLGWNEATYLIDDLFGLLDSQGVKIISYPVEFEDLTGCVIVRLESLVEE